MKKASKITILSFLFMVSQFLVAPIYAQSTDLKKLDFQEINQDWKGQLQYLNYGDDKSIFTIPCSLKTDFAKGKIKSVIVFDELDSKGKKMTNKVNFRLTKNGKCFRIGREKWEVISAKESAQKIEIIAQKRGKDNGQSADLKITWILEKGKSISWKKDVRYDGTDNFFNRNAFTFSKI